MDLRHLRSFIAVAEELSFRRAAGRLHISLPPLSRQIRTLEDELGVQLLERERRKRVCLTDAGRAFLIEARRTIASAEEALRSAREAHQGSRVELCLANIAALSARVLPPLLQAFRAAYPHIGLSVVEMERDEQENALCERRIHVGIYPGDPPGASHFQSQALFSCPMVVVVPPGHELAKEDHSEVDVLRFADEKLLIPSPKVSPGYLERLNYLRASAGFTPSTLHPIEGIQNLLAMVNAGYGVAILPEVLVNVPARTLRLAAPVPRFKLMLISLRNAPSIALKNFLAVAERFRTDGRGAPDSKRRCIPLDERRPPM
jgi:DNA-binding transcriptional LysR family regulator